MPAARQSRDPASAARRGERNKCTISILMTKPLRFLRFLSPRGASAAERNLIFCSQIRCLRDCRASSQGRVSFTSPTRTATANLSCRKPSVPVTRRAHAFSAKPRPQGQPPRLRIRSFGVFRAMLSAGFPAACPGDPRRRAFPLRPRGWSGAGRRAPSAARRRRAA